MPSLEQHLKDSTDEIRNLIRTLERNGNQMVDAVADMTAAVTGALDEMAVMTAALVAAPKDNTAAIEALAVNLNTAVANAKAALAPAPVVVPAPTPAVAPTA